MIISVLTIMPDLFDSFLQAPVIARAVRNGVLRVEIIDIREYAPGSFRHIDDSPFGGGAGMVMRCQPVLDALRACKKRNYSALSENRKDFPEDRKNQSENGREEDCASDFMKNQPENRKEKDCASDFMKDRAAEQAAPQNDVRTVILSPAGRPYSQKKAHDFAETDHLILICGHYEGMDARIYPHADEQVSIGDYVLTGGELAAQVIIDSVARLLPGSLRDASTQEESFENGLLEYPQYTQPAVYEGEAVPEVLRSGDHEKIRKWRLQQSLLLTRKMRPDLFAAHELTKEEQALLEEAPPPVHL